jgi:hypothetical protein
MFDMLMQKKLGNGNGQAVGKEQIIDPNTGMPVPMAKESQGLPTLEDMRRGQQAKATGLGVSPGDFIKRVTARTKLPAPKTGITTA